jgi:hypothetical protein
MSHYKLIQPKVWRHIMQLCISFNLRQGHTSLIIPTGSVSLIKELWENLGMNSLKEMKQKPGKQKYFYIWFTTASLAHALNYIVLQKVYNKADLQP